MKNLKSHFKFNKQERSGIFFLLLLIIGFQCLYFYFRNHSLAVGNKSLVINETEGERVDSLLARAKQKDTLKTYPFNPNFISDYKGYTLGMSPEEIDRLHAFRAAGKFLSSAREFQEITKVSDSLLHAIQDNFKFPKWQRENQKRSKPFYAERKLAVPRKDLNRATAMQLRVVSGIGEKLSARIIKFRDRLGGFMDSSQLYDVYGLEKEVAEKAIELFEVKNPPAIQKININNATASELSKLIYIPYQLAENIVAYRNKNDAFHSFEELSKVDGFPTPKLHRIALYLSL